MVTVRCKDKVFHNIQAILFDKDGTLADSESFLRHLGQKRSRLIDAQIPGVQDPLLMAFGLDGNRLNPAGLLAVGTRLENEIAAAAYVAETGRDWAESLALVRSAFKDADSYMPQKAEQTPPFPGISDLLQTLATAGIRLGIVSSDTSDNIADFICHYNLDSYFQAQVGGDSGYTKPNPALLQPIFAQFQICPEAVLVVGDSQLDMELGQAAGVAGCIGVTWGWSQTFQLTGASVVLSQFDQLYLDR